MAKENMKKKYITTIIAVVVVGLLVFLVFCMREGLQNKACRGNMRCIGLALSMYAQSWEGEYPPDLLAIFPDIVNDPKIFISCPYFQREDKNINDQAAWEYLDGLTEKTLSDSIVMFCRESHRGKRRNVLYIDCFVPFLKEEDFQKELRRMLNTPEYRKQYTEEAIKIMEKYLEEE